MPEITTVVDDLMGQPFYGSIGNPTTAAGAGMVSFGLAPRIEITLRFLTQMLSNELGQVVGKGFEAFQGGDVVLTLKRRNAVILAAFFKSPTAGAASLGFNPSLQSRDQLTLALVPVNVADPTDPTEAANRWCTNIIFTEIGAFVAKVEQSKESDTYTLTGTLARATTDQAGQGIEENYGCFFSGSAVDALTGTPASPWTLPDPTA